MENIFDTFASPLIGLPVRHIWQGYGSAIFLEFGELRRRLEQDGSASQSEGQTVWKASGAPGPRAQTAGHGVSVLRSEFWRGRDHGHMLRATSW